MILANVPLHNLLKRWRKSGSLRLPLFAIGTRRPLLNRKMPSPAEQEMQSAAEQEQSAAEQGFNENQIVIPSEREPTLRRSRRGGEDESRDLLHLYLPAAARTVFCAAARIITARLHAISSRARSAASLRAAGTTETSAST